MTDHEKVHIHYASARVGGKLVPWRIRIHRSILESLMLSLVPAGVAVMLLRADLSGETIDLQTTPYGGAIEEQTVDRGLDEVLRRAGFTVTSEIDLPNVPVVAVADYQPTPAMFVRAGWPGACRT